MNRSIYRTILCVSIHGWLLSKAVYPALREWGVYTGGAVNIYMMYPYIHAYIHTCMHTYMHAYIHTYIHAYIHLFITCRWLLSKVVYPALREWGVYIGGAVIPPARQCIYDTFIQPSIHL